MIRILISIFLSGILIGCAVKKESSVDTNLSSEFDSKVDSILNLMTLQEKIGQLNQYSVGEGLTGPGAKSNRDSIRYRRLMNGEVGAVLNLLGAEQTLKMQKMVMENSRLKIPLLFAYDVVHGYKTIFPIPLGESASWDLDAIRKSAEISAKEAASAGLNWTFAPMVDITRDARWGRVMEGAGEDPFLGSTIARARVNGFQGKDLANEYTIAACAKHFAGYGFAESGKDYNTVNVGRNELLNMILPPFKAAEEAGVATFMNAFNDIDGVPASADSYLLQDILQDQWGFKGFVVSDWNSIGEIVNHGTAADSKDAAYQAILAGTHMDMEADAFIENLESLVKEGKVQENIIDDAVKRVLKIKYELGLFDDPYRYSNVARENDNMLNDEHLDLVRDVARKSIVLLKNEKNLLPLKTKNVAVIGPLAKDKDTPLGNWRAAAEAGSAVSFYEGLTKAFGKELPYAEGTKLSIGPNNFFQQLEIEKNDRSGFEEAKKVAEQAEVVIMVLGETAYMSGEGRSRSEIGLPGLQLELLKAVHEVNKNIILVLMNGRPLTIPWEAENIPAIVETWHLGSEAGNAIADVLTGAYNPSGKLPMSFPKHVGQIPIYYNYKNTGRPSTEEGMVFYSHYNDIDNNAQFPFGYGLSYSDFQYSNLKLSAGSIKKPGSLVVSVEVTNNSKVAGYEVVQLYIRDMVASVTRPVKELKGFEKIYLESGEKRVVNFEISDDDLAFFGRNNQYGSEPGEFRVFVGGNSRDVLEANFSLL